MTVVDLDIPSKVYSDINHNWKLRYQDIIEHYEWGFEYEKIWQKASDFKDYLIKELSND